MDTKIVIKQKFKINKILIIKFSLNLDTFIYIDYYGPLVQQIERSATDGEVEGAIPSRATKNKG